MTTENIIFEKAVKINSVETLTVAIEETFMGNYSIVAYTDVLFVEKFANDVEEAKTIALKLFVKYS